MKQISGPFNGRILAQILEERQISKGQFLITLARRTGRPIEERIFARILRGKQAPSNDLVSHMAEILGVSQDRFFEPSPDVAQKPRTSRSEPNSLVRPADATLH